MIRYIISDFDGTLVDTYEANVNAYKETFNELGYPFNEDVYKESFGLRLDDMLDRQGISQNKVIRDKIKSKKSEIYSKYVHLIKRNDYLLKFIASLGNNVKVAIATTASKKNFENVCNSVLPGLKCDVTVTGEDVEYGKPDPQVYIKAMEKLGCEDPSQVLVFEDSQSGIKAASAAGIKAIIKVSL